MDGRCPVCNRPWLTERGDAMAAMVAQGKSLSVTADAFGVSSVAVLKACRARGVQPQGKPGRPRKDRT